MGLQFAAGKSTHTHTWYIEGGGDNALTGAMTTALLSVHRIKPAAKTSFLSAAKNKLKKLRNP